MTTMVRAMSTFANPQAIVDAGEQIYKEKYKTEFEKEHPGKFAAIDVQSGHAYIADQPEEALNKGRAASPTGYFHLIRVGASGAYRVSYVSKNAHSDWIFR